MSIKVNNKIVSLKSVVKAEVVSNWDNSMGTYYPYVLLTMFYSDDKGPEYERIDLSEHNNPIDLKLEYEPCTKQTYYYELYLKRVKEGIENKIVRRDKLVRVIRGRKLPIGTEGIVFWIGNTKYGESVGIELSDKTRVFTARSNVVVIEAA